MAQTPIINGHRYSFASIDVTANGQLFVGITRISYGSSLKPGKVRGTDGEFSGRTPGDAEHRCEIEMLQREFGELLESLGPGFGLIPFDIQVAFAESVFYEASSSNFVNRAQASGAEGVITHTIRGCRISEVDFQGQDGPEPNKVRVTLDPDTIVYGAADAAGAELTIDFRPDMLPSNLRETR